jgi:hypothetical protein
LVEYIAWLPHPPRYRVVPPPHAPREEGAPPALCPQVPAAPSSPARRGGGTALPRGGWGATLPDLAESIKRSRGRPPVETPRQQISIRLEPDVIAKFKATGKGWQSRINDVLKAAKV